MRLHRKAPWKKRPDFLSILRRGSPWPGACVLCPKNKSRMLLHASCGPLGLADVVLTNPRRPTLFTPQLACGVYMQ